jgi:hypothetical protein
VKLSSAENTLSDGPGDDVRKAMSVGQTSRELEGDAPGEAGTIRA